MEIKIRFIESEKPEEKKTDKKSIRRECKTIARALIERFLSGPDGKDLEAEIGKKLCGRIVAAVNARAVYRAINLKASTVRGSGILKITASEVADKHRDRREKLEKFNSIRAAELAAAKAITDAADYEIKVNEAGT